MMATASQRMIVSPTSRIIVSPTDDLTRASRRAIDPLRKVCEVLQKQNCGGIATPLLLQVGRVVEGLVTTRDSALYWAWLPSHPPRK